MLAQPSKRSIGQMSCFYQAPPAILNPRIERGYCLTHTVPITARPAPVIARLDRAIQKLAQHAWWIIRLSRMITPELDYDSLKESKAKLSLFALIITHQEFL